MRYHFSVIGLAKIKGIYNIQCWQGSDKPNILIIAVERVIEIKEHLYQDFNL